MVHPGDEVTATVVKQTTERAISFIPRGSQRCISLGKIKTDAGRKTVIDVTVKGIVNGGVIAYVEGVRGFIPASKLSLNYVEDTNPYLNQPLQVQVIDLDQEKGRLILSAREILREKAQEERKRRFPMWK